MDTNQSHSKDVNIILASLKDIAAAVMYATQAGTLDEVLQRIAYVAQQVVNARYAALGIPDGKGNLSYFKVVGVTDEQIKAIGHLPVGRGLLGVIMRDRVTLRLERMHDDPRSVAFPKNHPPMTSLLGVPVQTGAQLFGMLYLCDRQDEQPFDEQDQWLVETMAGYAALAIAGIQLSEQQQRLTLLEERDRVGMELHDGIIQSLYAVGMQLQLMRISGNITKTGLDDSVRDLDTVIEDIRSYILNLKSSTYLQKTTREGLEEVVARLHIPESLHVQLEAPDRQPPFAAPVFESICQIAHEALSNILRHANAQNVKITAIEDEALFTLTIEDDGRGFDLNVTTDRTGMGLRNMRQRAHIHAGKLTLQSAPGEGTKLTLTLPLS